MRKDNITNNAQTSDAQSAWNRFYKSGKVQDYLAVAAYENSVIPERQGTGDEALHRRTDNKGAKGWRM